ncbi:MAG: HAD-IIIA family hydrolase [Lentisphaerae bacterium]|nr:HAD-IIIA family hydrolase [Lentisphaerota bacterium]
MISSADFQKITTLIFDVDGTLTDGRQAYLSNGENIKFFYHHDMHWLKMAIRAGLKVGTLSAAVEPVNRIVPEDILKLTFAVTGSKDKLETFEEILKKYQLTAEECLYVGDDIVDMPVIKRAGIGVAVADAVEELDEVADFRTKAAGGQGAACEIIRRVLKEKGLLDTIMERYRK